MIINAQLHLNDLVILQMLFKLFCKQEPEEAVRAVVDLLRRQLQQSNFSSLMINFKKLIKFFVNQGRATQLHVAVLAQ